MARSEAFLKVVAAEAALKHYLPLVEKLVTQSQARIFQAQTRHPDKILSLFEPHSVVIRKGKAHKPGHFVPGYDRCCPCGTRLRTFRNSI